MQIDQWERQFSAPPANLPQSQTDNPYWDIIRTIPGNDIDYRYDHIWSPDWTATLFTDKHITRNALCGQYTWAIPDPASLQFVAEHLGKQAVEIGAGTGYWAWQLSQLGVDMLAYDAAPPQLSGDNHWHSPRGGERSELLNTTRPVFFEVQEGTPELLAQHADRTLFLCWPPMSRMAWEAVNTYPGNRMVYIGESGGGCTADEAFFKRLSRKWEEVAEHRPIQWWGIHDYITVYERSEVGA